MRVRRSIIISLLNSNVNTAVMFLVGLFLARMLTPAQIGVFSLGAVVINLAAVLRDLGAQTYVVQKQGLLPEEASSAMGLMLCTAAMWTVVLWLIAPSIALYFGQPEIESVIHVMTISFMLVPISGVLSALLMRGLQAEKTAIVLSVSTLSFCVTALVLANHGAGALSMAWANVANVVTNVLGYWLFRDRGTLRWPSLRGWTPIVRYGGGVVANQLASVANQSAPDVAIGRLVDGHGVGVYSRANGLVSMFQQAVAPMLNYNVLPYVAHSGHTREVIAQQLGRAGALLSGLAWPVYVFLGVYAESVLGVLYGSQWLEAAPLVAMLCLTGAVKSPFMHLTLALQAVDKSWAAAAPNVAAFVVRAVVVLAVRPTDLLTLTWCLMLGEWVNTAITLHLARRHLHLGYREMAAHQWPSVVVGLGCLVVVLGFSQLTSTWSPTVSMLCAGPLTLVAWTALVFFSGHPLASEIRGILGKRKRA
ncbi:MAG: oligosaccharide flippase family protein [Rubrivivax sp.]|jgi:O-antigen/teichoic acid export membrane protein